MPCVVPVNEGMCLCAPGPCSSTLTALRLHPFPPPPDVSPPGSQGPPASDVQAGCVTPYSVPSRASSSHLGHTTCGLPASWALSPLPFLLLVLPELLLKQDKQALASRPWPCRSLCMGSSLPGFCSGCSLTLFTSSFPCHLLRNFLCSPPRFSCLTVPG